MFKWLRSKIHVTIETPPPAGVTSTTEPRIVNQESARVEKIRKSDLRFASLMVKEAGEEPRTYWYTERYQNGHWSQCGDSWFAEKDKALIAHMRIVEHGTASPERITTVLWEGLSKEETKSWVELQLPPTKEEKVI